MPSSSQLPGFSKDLGRRPGWDLTYNLAISADQAVSGGKILVDLSHLVGGRKISVNIPAGVKTGTRLRLKNLGEHLDDGIDRRGDLYLELRVD